MILDYNIFEKIKGRNKDTASEDKLFYILEQVPHNITAHDISNYLYEHQYFGSYNRAFFDETNKGLHTALLSKLYDTKKFQSSGSSRKKIFNYFAEKVTDIKTLKDLLRYNGYNIDSEFKDDPSKDDPSDSISPRNDIFDHYFGGIDTKVTNSEMVKEISAIAISGPTFENNPNLKPFEWSANEENQITRGGVPQKFDFPYILMSPKSICCDNTNDVFQW
jgi:hypothetical protein